MNSHSYRRRSARAAFSIAFFLVSLTATHGQTPGNVDTSFNPGTGTNQNVTGISLQSGDGKVVITGNFLTVNGVTSQHVARLNTDGSLDTTFNVGSGANANVVHSAVQPDGKIVIGGAFIQVNGVTRQHVARLNADGSVDATFDLGSGPDAIVAPIALQPDGKILIGGNFATVNGITRSGVARLNADGSVDATFDPGTGLDDGGSLIGIAVQSDGKILIAGTFGAVNGVTANNIARLNADGSVDTSYSSAGGATVSTGGSPFIFGVALQSDGKAIYTGGFNQINGVTRDGIARLNVDGSLDATFDPGSGANGVVLTAALQSDGKIVIGGIFTAFNGTTRANVARLNPDGSVDLSFDPGSGTNDFVNPIAIQADGKIVIGGQFISVNGTTREHIARLIGGSVHPAFFDGEIALANGVYYLAFPKGDPFGYYSYLSDPRYIYHFDLGYEYVFDAADGKSGVYLYDFASSGFFYTSPTFPFPYLYDFNLNSVVYYYPDPNNPGRYNTNGVRYFYDFGTGKIISK